MTNEDKRNYLLRFHRFQKSREKYFAPKIFAAIREQYNTLLTALNNGYTEQRAIQKIDASPIIKVLRELYVDAGTVYGAKVRADLNKAGKKSFAYHIEIKARMPMGFSEEMRRLIMDYFSIDILNQSEGITETTRELIRQVFTDAYELGEGIDDIIAKLKDTELSRVRSRLIARTETVSAANKGALFVAKDTGLNLNKEWLSAKDHRVRRDHRNENGQIIGINDLFTVGTDLMLHPGDRGGKDGRLKVSAKNVCNCRCTCLYIPID